MKLMIVDDSQDNLVFTRLLLESLGWKDLVLAQSATTAFNILGLDKPSRNGVDIDVILMDIRMPEIDGIQACRRIKQDRRFQDIPVVMVTAQSDETALENAFRAGACDYLSKPFKLVELKARLGSALALKQERDCRRGREQELLRVTQELEKVNRELQKLSLVDSLTGLANRRQFEALLHRDWRRAVRKKEPLSLIMIDIDHFKKYNDNYGHLKGDECLRRVAAGLQQGLHRSEDLVARLGGEEFVVLLPGTGPEGAAVVAETLRRQVMDLEILHDHSSVGPVVTISLGVASAIPQPGTSPRDLVDAADRALYQVKQTSRNGVALADQLPTPPRKPVTVKG